MADEAVEPTKSLDPELGSCWTKPQFSCLKMLYSIEPTSEAVVGLMRRCGERTLLLATDALETVSCKYHLLYIALPVLGTVSWGTYLVLTELEEVVVRYRVKRG